MQLFLCPSSSVAVPERSAYSLSLIQVPSGTKNRSSLSNSSFPLSYKKVINIFHSNKNSLNWIVFVRIV